MALAFFMGTMHDSKATNDLLMLRIELRAIRDRVMADLDAALAKIDHALPASEDSVAQSGMKSWDKTRWREYLETGK